MTQINPSFDPLQYKQTTREQWQSAAQAWNRWAPTLENWLGEATLQMIKTARIAQGQHILDLAAGAGGQTLQIAPLLGSTGTILATDISPNLLAFTANNAAQAGFTNIQTRVMDAEKLELPPESMDVVVCRLGFMYLPTLTRAMAEIFRVLKPGGRVAGLVFSSPDKTPFFSLPLNIIRKFAQLPPPLPQQPGPFSLGGEGVLHQFLEDAGFQKISIQYLPAPLKMSSAGECVRFEKEAFGALHQMLSKVDDQTQKLAWQEIEQQLSQFDGPDGFLSPCELISAVGEKP